jgi:uncharacterized membrane protein
MFQRPHLFLNAVSFCVTALFLVEIRNELCYTAYILLLAKTADTNNKINQREKNDNKRVL